MQAFIVDHQEEMQRKKNAISREPVQPVGIVSRVHQLIAGR
jgi:hypothetical protein